MDKIKENISERNGETLPIKERMLRSITREFTASGVNPEDIITNELRNWRNKIFYEKAKDADLGQAYFAMFGGGARNHGYVDARLQ